MVRWLVALGMVLAGCGTEERGPREKCDDLADLLCERTVGCDEGDTTGAECVAATRTEFSCAQAVAVSDRYDTCMDDLTVAPCSVLFADGALDRPPACDGAIVSRE